MHSSIDLIVYPSQSFFKWPIVNRRELFNQNTRQIWLIRDASSPINYITCTFRGNFISPTITRSKCFNTDKWQYLTAVSTKFDWNARVFISIVNLWLAANVKSFALATPIGLTIIIQCMGSTRSCNCSFLRHQTRNILCMLCMFSIATNLSLNSQPTPWAADEICS